MPPSPFFAQLAISFEPRRSAAYPSGMSHPSENPTADARALRLRLRKITGQLKGVEAMIEGTYDCAEVLNQLVSARRAIKSLAEKIINDHLEHCLKDPVAPETRRRQLKEVAVMLRRYVE